MLSELISALITTSLESTMYIQRYRPASESRSAMRFLPFVFDKLLGRQKGTSIILCVSPDMLIPSKKGSFIVTDSGDNAVNNSIDACHCFPVLSNRKGLAASYTHAHGVFRTRHLSVISHCVKGAHCDQETAWMLILYHDR